MQRLNNILRQDNIDTYFQRLERIENKLDELLDRNKSSKEINPIAAKILGKQNNT